MIHSGLIKDLKKKIKTAAGKGNLLVPSLVEKEGFVELERESSGDWPLVLLSKETTFTLIDIRADKAEIIGIQQSISQRQVHKDGLQFIMGILDRFDSYGILPRNMLEVFRYCRDKKLDFSFLVK